MTQDLILIENTDVTIFTAREKANDFLSGLRKNVMSIDRDVTTEKGRDNIRSVAFKIAKTKTAVEKAGKALVEEQKAAVKLVDSERIRLVNEIQSLQDDFRKPLTEFEDLEKERVKTHQDNVERLKVMVQNSVNFSAEDVEISKVTIENLKVGNHQEFKAKIDELIILAEDALVKRNQAIADALELERLRAEKQAQEQKASDEKIAEEARLKAVEEAKEVARLELERAEKLAEQARKDVEMQKLRAEQAEQKAKQDAINAETKRLADSEYAKEVERKRITKIAEDEAKALAKREADKVHTAAIHNKILEALVALELSPDVAKIVVICLEKGKIPHVSVKY